MTRSSLEVVLLSAMEIQIYVTTMNARGMMRIIMTRENANLKFKDVSLQAR